MDAISTKDRFDAAVKVIQSLPKSGKGLSIRRSSLKTGPARPGHAKIAIYITAVEFDQFSLYSTGTVIIYDRLSL